MASFTPARWLLSWGSRPERAGLGGGASAVGVAGHGDGQGRGATVSVGGLAQVRHVFGVLYWPLADDAAVGLDEKYGFPTAAEGAVAKAQGVVSPEFTAWGLAM